MPEKTPPNHGTIWINNELIPCSSIKATRSITGSSLNLELSLPEGRHQQRALIHLDGSLLEHLIRSIVHQNPREVIAFCLESSQLIPGES